MNVFEIILGAPFCVVGLLLYSFMATFKGLSTKTWFVPLVLATFTFYIIFLVKTFSGEVPLEGSWQLLLVFNLAILLIALSLYQFKKRHQLSVVNAVSFLLSAVAVSSLYQGCSFALFPKILLAVATALELGIWAFIVRSKVKMVDTKTDEVLLLPGNVMLAVMLVGFFILVFTSGVQKPPTDLDFSNGLCAVFLCRFLLTQVYLCVKTVYHARNNQNV